MPEIAFAHHNPPSKVLHLSVSNVKYKVTIDTCKKLLGHGLQKVLVREPFSGKGIVDVICEMVDVPTAQDFQRLLDGKFVYTGCNRIRANFSHLRQLDLVENSDWSHDFTKDALPK